MMIQEKTGNVIQELRIQWKLQIIYQMRGWNERKKMIMFKKCADKLATSEF